MRLLARLLYAQGKLNLEEAFVDATFASTKKGGFAVGSTRLGRDTKIVAVAAGNSLPPPSLSKALRLPSASLLKKFLPEAFSANFQSD